MAETKGEKGQEGGVRERFPKLSAEKKGDPLWGEERKIRHRTEREAQLSREKGRDLQTTMSLGTEKEAGIRKVRGRCMGDVYHDAANL